MTVSVSVNTFGPARRVFSAGVFDRVVISLEPNVRGGHDRYSIELRSLFGPVGFIYLTRPDLRSLREKLGELGADGCMTYALVYPSTADTIAWGTGPVRFEGRSLSRLLNGIDVALRDESVL